MQSTIRTVPSSVSKSVSSTRLPGRYRRETRRTPPAGARSQRLAVQNGIIGNDLSVTGAVIGAVTLFAINEVVSRTTYAFPWAARALEGDPTLLISQGKPIHSALRGAKDSRTSLQSILRSSRRTAS
jgi:hypothetical protein